MLSGYSKDVTVFFVLQIMTAIVSSGLMPNFTLSSLQTLTDVIVKWSFRRIQSLCIRSLLLCLRCAAVSFLVIQTCLFVAY